MSVLGNFTKQPAEVETYSIIYEDDLTANDNLTGATTVIAPAGLVEDFTTFIDTPGDRRVRVKLSGGTAGVRYKVTVTPTTADGRVLQDEFYVRVKDY